MSKKRSFRRTKSPLAILTFLLGIGVGCGTYEYFPQEKIAISGEADTCFDIRFSPRGGGLQLILDTLNKAQDHIYVHAYSFTSQEITEALIHAHQRGVHIQVIADKRESKSRYCRLHELLTAGIEVRIDKVGGLAHNKVMIVDEKWLITGSFNWSAAAEKRNAENILRITSEKVNACFTKNFFLRYGKGSAMS